MHFGLSRPRACGFLAILLAATSMAHATWSDSAWPFRRAIDVAWDAEQQGDDGEIAQAEFYTAGHSLPKGEDIRVATEDGRICAVRVIQSGPGDRVRIVFQLTKLQKKYYVYWGNPKPPAQPRTLPSETPIRFGLLYESRGLDNQPVNNIRQLESAWQNGKPEYGAAMIERPFIGYNPVTDSDRTIGRVTGSLFAPQDGDYDLAAACKDRGAVFVDGQPLLYIAGPAGDARFHKVIHLTRGRHDFLMYHLNFGNGMWISVDWKRPDSQKYEIIERESFGLCPRGTVGVLEEIRKNLTADMKFEYAGECFEHDPRTKNDAERGNYSHRYRFAAWLANEPPAMKIDWDFGDGQTAEGAYVEHVFLTNAVYPVRLTYRVGASADSQTNKLSVARDLARADHPPTDEPAVQSRLVARYDVSAMPVDWLPWASVLHEKAGAIEPMFEASTRLAMMPHHADALLAYEALMEMTRADAALARMQQLVGVWARVPQGSDLQPRAAKEQANLLLWHVADFAAAEQAVAPYVGGNDPGIARRRAQALLLMGKVDEARKILLAQPIEGVKDREAAISGAMARTVEFYITEKEPEAGEEAWELWQARYPADFLQGYAIVLKVKLIALAGHAEAAAKVAEAFARSVPNSSYAPQLLDAASKLFAKSDPKKGATLRALLKEKYPEDPLSQ